MNEITNNDWNSMTNTALMATIGNYIQWHRLNQNKSQDQIAEEAGISRSTLSLLERGENVRMDSFIQVLRTLDLLYIMDSFIIKNEISPIAYAKLKKKQRKQASPRKKKNNNEEDLGW